MLQLYNIAYNIPICLSSQFNPDTLYYVNNAHIVNNSRKLHNSCRYTQWYIQTHRFHLICYSYSSLGRICYHSLDHTNQDDRLSMINYWQWNLVPAPLSLLYIICMFTVTEHIINEQEEFVVIMYDRSCKTNRVNGALFRQNPFSTSFTGFKDCSKNEINFCQRITLFLRTIFRDNIFMFVAKRIKKRWICFKIPFVYISPLSFRV